jgi:hypothetical protein
VRDRVRDHRRRTSPESPLGEAIETFIRRENAERFIEKVRGNDPELASYLPIEEWRRAGSRSAINLP